MSVDIEKIEAVLAKITPAPWYWEHDPADNTDALYSDAPVNLAEPDLSGGAVLWGQDKNDFGAYLRATEGNAAFIAAAPQMVIDLVAEVKRLEASRAELIKGYNQLKADMQKDEQRRKEDGVQ